VGSVFVVVVMGCHCVDVVQGAVVVVQDAAVFVVPAAGWCHCHCYHVVGCHCHCCCCAG